MGVQIGLILLRGSGEFSKSISLNKAWNVCIPLLTVSVIGFPLFTRCSQIFIFIAAGIIFFGVM